MQNIVLENSPRPPNNGVYEKVKQQKCYLQICN